MAKDPRGGYRPTAPQNNTGVSATGGAGSKNGTPQPMRVAPGGQYGDRKAMITQQQGAPMASDTTPNVPSKPLIPLMAPTQRPHEPVTTGVKDSPGAGPEVLHLPNQTQAKYGTAYDMFQAMANEPNASPALQYLAQRIKSVY